MKWTMQIMVNTLDGLPSWVRVAIRVKLITVVTVEKLTEFIKRHEELLIRLNPPFKLILKSVYRRQTIKSMKSGSDFLSILQCFIDDLCPMKNLIIIRGSQS